MKNYLWLPGWQTEEPIIEDKAVTIPAEYTVLPDHCPHCGAVGRLYSHGPRDIDYRDIPIFAKRTTIRVSVKRFRCRECSKTSTQPLPHMHPRRQMTIRCVDHLRDQCRTRNYAEMSRETGIDESVVRAICNEEYALMKATRRPLAPVILGIDELTITYRRRCIFVDVGTKTTLDLMPGMAKASVVHWLSNMREKHRVRIVTMDMWKDYRLAAEAVLPNAKVVIDRWHVQKNAGDALDKIRTRHRRLLDAEAKKIDGDKAKKRKNPWHIKRVLQTSRHRLKPKAAFLLEGLLKNAPLVSDGWHTKEAFYDIWDSPDRATAEAAYDEWVKTIPASVAVEFGEVVKTIKNWREPIFAYFDHRYTNAFTEATNGLIKEVHRSGRGYGFPQIRAKALLMTHASDGKFFVCESCLGQFDTSLKQLSPTFALDNHSPRRLALCPDCSDLSTFADWLEQSGTHVISHLKNG